MSWKRISAATAFLVACHGPLPMEYDEYQVVTEHEKEQAEILSGYGVVDASSGVYKVPIEQAMRAVAADPSLLAPVVEKKEVNLEEMTLVQQGEYHFNNTYVCASCHGFEGVRKIGPPLNNRWGKKAEIEGGDPVVFNDAYFKESVWYSRNKISKGYPPAMPVFDGIMTPEHYEAIKAYVKTYQ